MVTACDCILGCSPWCLGFLFVGVLGVVVCGLLLVCRCFGLLIWLDLVLPVFGVCGCRWFVGACGVIACGALILMVGFALV